MSTIPRLLRRPFLWVPVRTPFAPRHASTQHPKTLTKPTKFTPPSHPSSRLLSHDPINYPGPPTPPRDPTRRYPNTMPLPNTWAHFFLTSKVLHFYISMGILIGLAGFVSMRNFLRTSPFAKTMYWDWRHPKDSIGSLVMAIKIHVEEDSKRVGEIRKKRVEDVGLRGEYRRAHGLEKSDAEGGFGGWAVRWSGREPGSEESIPGEAPGPGGEGWIEDQIKKVEEEAVKLAEDARETADEGAVVAVTVSQEPVKKSSWW